MGRVQGIKRHPRATSRDVSGGTSDAMGCTNSLGSMPVKSQGADSPGKTRLLFDSLLPRGLPKNELAWPELCSKQDIWSLAQVQLTTNPTFRKTSVALL